MLPEEKRTRSFHASASLQDFYKREFNQIYPLPLLENEPPEALKGQVILISFVWRKPVNIGYSLPMLEDRESRAIVTSQDSAAAAAATSKGVTLVITFHKTKKVFTVYHLNVKTIMPSSAWYVTQRMY